jgi:hypothetical protein
MGVNPHRPVGRQPPPLLKKLSLLEPHVHNLQYKGRVVRESPGNMSDQSASPASPSL